MKGRFAAYFEYEYDSLHHTRLEGMTDDRRGHRDPCHGDRAWLCAIVAALGQPVSPAHTQASEHGHGHTLRRRRRERCGALERSRS